MEGAMDLDEPADVHWPEHLSPNDVSGGQKKSCETVAEAVRFVMETLPAASRPFAWIAAFERYLDYEEIQAIYQSDVYKVFKG
jgi:hypothetical protein